MLDIKTFKSALEQLEEERKIPKEKILDAIEQAMAAAYKKDYGKKGQIIRAKFDLETGKTDFFQIKIVVDESIVRLNTSEEENAEYLVKEEGDERVHFNPEHHIMIDDATEQMKLMRQSLKLQKLLLIQNDHHHQDAQAAPEPEAEPEPEPSEETQDGGTRETEDQLHEGPLDYYGNNLYYD